MNQSILNLPAVLFVSGIDTDAGKTVATAWLVRQLRQSGRSVVTVKFIQTGCTGTSEDIEAHRRLCGMDPLPEDLDGTTAPIIFSYPASAQLAARIDGRDINLDIIDGSIQLLSTRYDHVLVEGAGGLMVPITDTYTTIDYISERQLPVALVTNSRLGSINHTLLSLEALHSRGIQLSCVLYNTFYDNDPEISADTYGYISRLVQREYPDTTMYRVPRL